MTKSKPLMNMEAVAERLGTTPRHVRRLVSERRIPFGKVGRLVRFDPDQIDLWIEKNSVAASTR